MDDGVSNKAAVAFHDSGIAGERHYYSVPYQFARQKVNVRFTAPSRGMSLGLTPPWLCGMWAVGPVAPSIRRRRRKLLEVPGCGCSQETTISRSPRR